MCNFSSHNVLLNWVPELPPDLPPVPLPQLLAPVDAALLLIILWQFDLVLAAAAAGLRGRFRVRRPGGRRPRASALRRLDEEGVELAVVDVLHPLLGAPPQRGHRRRCRRRRRTPRSEVG